MQSPYVLPSKDFQQNAHVPSLEAYRSDYERSVKDPTSFWSEVAGRVAWETPFEKVLEWDFHAGSVKWFEDGTLNVTVSCLDRHVAAGDGERTAILWEGDEPGQEERISYVELLRRVCRCANVLKRLGVGRGDRVCIYMPMIPDLAVVMLACARIGAIHSIVFGGFSSASLRQRILDAECKLVVTADEGVRGGRTIPLKRTTDDAVEGVDCVEKVLVVRHTGGEVPMQDGRDVWLHVELAAPGVEDACPPVIIGAEDPLFILYTSGSTGTPKGVVHTAGGYLVYASYTHELIFDLRKDDVYWCTADIGWITGHSYIIYGPLANGATTLMFGGTPSYPDHGRFWDVVDKYGVTIFYTAPTAIRALMRHGEEPVRSRSRKSLRLLGTVGEPINPEVWRWYHEVVGDERCPIVDTWWQTETGGILISSLPGAIPMKPGSATLPFYGIQPAILDDEGRVLPDDPADGNLCIAFPWPGIARTIYGNHERYRETYFGRFPGYYATGDGCRRDSDGYYWITGRVDDVLNVSGHRMGTAEVESALLEHHGVAEAAVVGMPHEIKGQGIYAFVTLRDDVEGTDELRRELIQTVRTAIGPIAAPDVIQFTDALPKTRSGKIMRRILRKVAAGDVHDLGDTSTLADPSVVESLVRGRGQM
ncbi:MAG TPA: acetate--CoA ligase [Planctomycetes bacterium]|nr:acetate--CoA ligase [Planctomycetota bacterium]